MVTGMAEAGSSSRATLRSCRRLTQELSRACALEVLGEADSGRAARASGLTEGLRLILLQVL